LLNKPTTETLRSIVLRNLEVVGPYPVRTVYTKSRLSRKQFVSRNAGFLDGLPTNVKCSQ